MNNHKLDGKCPACDETATKADLMIVAISILLAVCLGFLVMRYC